MSINPHPPCDSTELVKFRNRIGKEGVEKIFSRLRTHALHQLTANPTNKSNQLFIKIVVPT